MTQPVSLQLISLWTLTGVTSWAVDTLVLTHVIGEAALIDVCTEYMHTCGHSIHTQYPMKTMLVVHKHSLPCNDITVFVYVCVCVCVFTLAVDRVLRQLVALVTLAEEGANEVIAVVLTRTLHVTLVHIWKNKHMFDIFGCNTGNYFSSLGQKMCS